MLDLSEPREKFGFVTHSLINVASTETHFNNGVSMSVFINTSSYSVFRKDCSRGGGGGGVAIAVKNFLTPYTNNFLQLAWYIGS